MKYLAHLYINGQRTHASDEIKIDIIEPSSPNPEVRAKITLDKHFAFVLLCKIRSPNGRTGVILDVFEPLPGGHLQAGSTRWCLVATLQGSWDTKETTIELSE